MKDQKPELPPQGLDFTPLNFDEPDPRICTADDPDAEDVVNAYREAGRDFIAFFDQILFFIMSHPDPKLAAWVAAMASGRHLLTGGISGKELGERLGLTKAAVSKSIKTLQARLGNDIAGTPAMPGQRSVESCQKFAQIRNSQLENKND